MSRLVRRWIARFLAGPAFLPASIVVVCVLVALTGAQVTQVYLRARAADWWVYHDPITFSGPGLGHAPTDVEATVLGAVQQPGAYVLPQGARVADLIATAGGLLPDADASAVSETAMLLAGQQVYVPYQGQAHGWSTAVVSINAASAEELHAALGITAATASRIVAYRGQHGPFTALSQLLLVPITRTTFDRIKYLVSL